MKPILFIDFDGTLCHDKYWRSLASEILQKIKIFEFDEERKIAHKWMRGEYTSEEVNVLVAEEIGMPYEELWEIFVENCSTMFVSPQVLNKLNALRDRYLVVLMTDNMDSFDRFTVPALELENYFDLIVNSYTEKRGKNEEKGSLFLDVAKRFGSDIEESCLFDNSQDACSTFRNLGGTSYLVTPEQDLEYWLDTEYSQDSGF